MTWLVFQFFLASTVGFWLTLLLKGPSALQLRTHWRLLLVCWFGSFLAPLALYCAVIWMRRQGA